MNVIMPVVGEGRRFKEAGFHEDKPFIRMRGKRMIDWALDPIPADWWVWVICRFDRFFTFQAAISHTHPKIMLHTLPGATDGAAASVLSAVVGLPPDEPVAVINCDQWFRVGGNVRSEDYRSLVDLTIHAMNQKWDGYILTFEGEGTRWSYVKEDQHGWIDKVAEKEPISDQATVGFYWFRRARDLRWAICNMIAHHVRSQGEYYLAPAYNELIWECRKKIKAVPVDEFISLGTPDDVRSFQERHAPGTHDQRIRVDVE